MAPSQFLLFDFSGEVVLMKFRPLVWNVFYPWSSFENDLLISSVYEASSSICMTTLQGGCLSVWVTSSEGDSQMNWSHLRVASHPRKGFVVIYCLMSLWLIEACTIGSLAGFEPQTIAATQSAIWTTMLWFFASLFFLLLSYCPLIITLWGPYCFTVPLVLLACVQSSLVTSPSVKYL